VGLLDHLSDAIGTLPRAGDVALVIGTTRGHLGQSALLAELWGRADGDAPPVDLTAERTHGEFLRAHRAHVRAATDLGDGGLALAAFELAAGAGIGVALDPGDLPTLFGEDQARYLVACAPDAADALTAAGRAAGIDVVTVGRFGGSDVVLGTARAPLAELDGLWRGALGRALGLD
jgi:phosphoribosylformylglycinamidine synthase subunit PurL